MGNLQSMRASPPSKVFSTPDERDAWLMSKIALAETLKPGSPVLNPEANNLLLDLYSETLDEIGPERFEAAFREVLRSSRFRPDISEIRTAAGVNRGIRSPTEEHARRALAEVLCAIRSHGPTLTRNLLGKVLRERDDDGRVLQLPERGPSIAPPTFDERTEAAIVACGFGSREKGLEFLSEHSAAQPPKSGQTAMEAGYRVTLSTAIERKWVLAWVER